MTDIKNSELDLIKNKQRLERLKELMREIGLNQRNFAKQLGMTQGAISLMFVRERGVTKLMALGIEHLYGFNHEWILEGIEPKKLLISTVVERKVRRLSAEKRKLVFQLIDAL